MIRVKLSIAIFCIFISGCTSPEPKTLYYYNTATCSSDCNLDNDVNLILDAAKPSSSSGLRFSNISGEAQAALINQSTPEQRASLLRNTPFAGSQANIDRSRVNQSRNISISLVESQKMHPANRVQSAALKIKAPENWKIDDISKFTDVNALIALGSITRSQTASVTAGLTGTGPVVGSLSSTNSETESATQQVARSITSTQYTLKEGDVEIFVRSTLPQITASRSYTFSASLEYTGRQHGVAVSRFSYSDDKPKLDQFIAIFPDKPGGNIEASGTYRFRSVINSVENLDDAPVRSIEEDDDNIRWSDIEFSPQSVPLSKASRSEWVYFDYRDSAGQPSLIYISPKEGTGKSCFILQYSDQAHRFLKWVKSNKKTSFSNWALQNSTGRRIKKNEIDSINIRNGRRPIGGVPMLPDGMDYVWQLDKLKECAFPFFP